MAIPCNPASVDRLTSESSAHPGATHKARNKEVIASIKNNFCFIISFSSIFIHGFM